MIGKGNTRRLSGNGPKVAKFLLGIIRLTPRAPDAGEDSMLRSYERCCKRQPSERLRNVERILKVTKKSGNRERDVGCCLYETDNLKNETISRITTLDY